VLYFTSVTVIGAMNRDKPGCTPAVTGSPLVMECRIADEYSTPGFESFICSINGTSVEKGHLNEEGKSNYHTRKPVLFEFPTYEYLKTGEVIGRCLSFKEQV